MINTLLQQKGVRYSGKTKVVPAFAVGSGAYVGGAQIQGLADRIEDAVKMRVWVAEDSMTCVARGAGRVLEDLDNFGRVLVSLDRGSTHH